MCVNRTNCFCSCNQGLSSEQTESNQINIVPIKGLDLYELDIAMGKITSDVTYEEWRAMNIILTSPNGTKYIIRVDDDGVLSSQPV